MRPTLTSTLRTLSIFWIRTRKWGRLQENPCIVASQSSRTFDSPSSLRHLQHGRSSTYTDRIWCITALSTRKRGRSFFRVFLGSWINLLTCWISPQMSRNAAGSKTKPHGTDTSTHHWSKLSQSYSNKRRKPFIKPWKKPLVSSTKDTKGKRKT